MDKPARWHELTTEQKCKVEEYISTLLAEQLELDIVEKPGREVVKQERRGSVCYQLELVRCGKEKCKCTEGKLHGPYWYAYYRQSGRLKSKYIGKKLQEDSL